MLIDVSHCKERNKCVYFLRMDYYYNWIINITRDAQYCNAPYNQEKKKKLSTECSNHKHKKRKKENRVSNDTKFKIIDYDIYHKKRVNREKRNDMKRIEVDYHEYRVNEKANKG